MTDLKVIPRLSEKSVAQAATGIYLFNVPLKANKQQIAAAIGAQFGVNVVTVNVAVAKGKVKKTYRKGGSPVVGKRNDVKKAYVTLAEGQKIAAFEQESE